MIVRIAWRNIWRNKTRSLVVIGSIILGVWAGIFVMGLTNGLNEKRIKNAIETRLSHIQVHSEAFVDDKKVENALPEPERVREALAKAEAVRHSSFRTVVNGMASSPAGGFGVRINGVHPESESQVTVLDERLVKGRFFKEGGGSNQVVIGKALMEKMKLDPGSKLILQFQDKAGRIRSGAFRIKGVFETASSGFDERNIFIRESDMQRFLGEKAVYHEVAVLLKDRERIPAVKASLEEKLPDLAIRSWKTIAPSLGYADDLMAQMMYIFLGIILLALAFGIVNTMLMAVLERTKELGMLMSVGMNRARVFFMILWETVFISLVSGPVGILLAYGTVEYFRHQGLDLSMVAQGLKSIGAGTRIHPQLETVFYLNIALIVVLTAILSSLYPAWKALQLRPAEAVRAV